MAKVIKYLCCICGTDRNLKGAKGGVAICKDCYENLPLYMPIEAKYKSIVENED